jgi:hypothetical protein
MNMRHTLLVAVLALCVRLAGRRAVSSSRMPAALTTSFLLGLHPETAGDSAGAAAAYEQAEKLDPQSAEIPAALAA